MKLAMEADALQVLGQKTATAAQWNQAGTEVEGIISAIRTSQSENDEIARRGLQQAASYIPD